LVMPQDIQITSKPLAQLVEECHARPLVFDGVRPELCPTLKQIVLDRMQHDHGRKAGSLNIGGWKSKEDLFSWPDVAVQELRETIISFVGECTPVAWAMVNHAGSWHPRHQHRIAILSGVYYVAPGSKEVVPTIYECPCDAQIARSNTSYDLEVEPHPGRLVICRGETWHRVPTCAGKLPRITLVFDVRR
jgi:hypothetical protein